MATRQRRTQCMRIARLLRSLLDLPVPAFTATVEIVIDFVFARPKSHLRKAGLAANAPQWPRQDIDNLEKAVLDALNGVAWNDDSQVVRVVKSKSYGTKSCTSVTIT